MVEQDAGFDIAAAAEFDQKTLGPQCPANLGRVFAQDVDLSTSEIIFVELADLLKKVTADFVIKKFRCDPFGALRETT